MEQINETTYEITLAGGDKVEIGDREAIDFIPHIKLNRWGGECFIAVKPANLVETEVEYEVEGDKVKCKYKVKQGEFEEEWETEFYSLEPRIVIVKDNNDQDIELEQCKLGGFEFEVILKEKPLTNQIVLEIESQGLKFYYQPELTPEEIEEGCSRPDNVVGSYAVYHATCGNMHKGVATAEKYKCGKAFHIYRPRITDAEGNWVWGELFLDEQAGTLTTTISQDFLDTAVYPVSTGTSNFGFEAIGGSPSHGAPTFIVSSQESGAAGTGISMTAYFFKYTTAGNFKYALFDISGDNFTTMIPNGETSTGLVPNIPIWKTENFLIQPTLFAVEYALRVMFAEDTNFYFDSAAGNSLLEEGETWPTWTINQNLSVAKRFSIFCTYEPGGPPPGGIGDKSANMAATLLGHKMI